MQRSEGPMSRRQRRPNRVEAKQKRGHEDINDDDNDDDEDADEEEDAESRKHNGKLDEEEDDEAAAGDYHYDKTQHSGDTQQRRSH